MSYKIDLSKSENLNNKVMSEKETRRKLLQHAREVGCEGDMIKILDKYDNLLRNCTNDKERKDISSLGAYEVYRLLGGGGELYVNGQLVAKDD
jgi:CTP-dependent riboflavin kinase